MTSRGGLKNVLEALRTRDLMILLEASRSGDLKSLKN
jgi:hypothetical protein